MNHYEIKLEYDIDIPDWGTIIPNQHYKTLVEADGPLEAIEEAKEWIGDGEVFEWRVATARRIPVPANVLFLGDTVTRGDGWASDLFVALPLENAMWIDEYLFKPVREIDFEERLFSDLDLGDDIEFARYGTGRGLEYAALGSPDGKRVAINRRYYDFVTSQLHATAWLRCPMKSRPGDCCVVARDATGHPVAYIMPYVDEVLKQ